MFLLFSGCSMVEATYSRWSSQKKMSQRQIQQLIKKMKHDRNLLPKITSKAKYVSQKDQKTAEQQLDTFLNS